MILFYLILFIINSIYRKLYESHLRLYLPLFIVFDVFWIWEFEGSYVYDGVSTRFVVLLSLFPLLLYYITFKLFHFFLFLTINSGVGWGNRAAATTDPADILSVPFSFSSFFIFIYTFYVYFILFLQMFCLFVLTRLIYVDTIP